MWSRRCLEKSTSIYPWILRTQYLVCRNHGIVGSQKVQILHQSQISKALRNFQIQYVRFHGGQQSINFSFVERAQGRVEEYRPFSEGRECR